MHLFAVGAVYDRAIFAIEWDKRGGHRRHRPRLQWEVAQDILRTMNRLFKWFLPLGLFLTASGCVSSGAHESPGDAMSTSAESNQTTGCIEQFDAGKDYFPQKAALRYATNFSVEYHKSFKLVTVAQA